MENISTIGMETTAKEHLLRSISLIRPMKTNPELIEPYNFHLLNFQKHYNLQREEQQLKRKQTEQIQKEEIKKQKVQQQKEKRQIPHHVVKIPNYDPEYNASFVDNQRVSHKNSLQTLQKAGYAVFILKHRGQLFDMLYFDAVKTNAFFVNEQFSQDTKNAKLDEIRTACSERIPSIKRPYQKYYEHVQNFRLSEFEVHKIKLPFFVIKNEQRVWGKLSNKYGNFHLATYTGETLVNYEDLGFYSVYNLEHLDEFVDQNIQFDKICWIDLSNTCANLNDDVLNTIKKLKQCVSTGGELKIIQRTIGKAQSSSRP